MKDRHNAYVWIVLTMGSAMAVASAARFFGFW